MPRTKPKTALDVDKGFELVERPTKGESSRARLPVAPILPSSSSPGGTQFPSFADLPPQASSATIPPLPAPSQTKFDATLKPGFASYVADLRESKFKQDFANLVLQIAGSDGFSRFVVAKQPRSNVPQTAAELIKSTLGADNYELLLRYYDPDLLNKSEREEQARLLEGDRFLAKKQIQLFRREDGKVGLNVHYYDFMYEHAGKAQRKPGSMDDEYVLEQDGFKPFISKAAQGYDPELTMTTEDLQSKRFSEKSPLGILFRAGWVSRFPGLISGSSVTSFMLDINRGILVNSGSCTSDINLKLLLGKAMSQEEAAKAVLDERLGIYIDKEKQVETFKAINDYYHQYLMGGEIKSQLAMMAARSPVGCNYLVTSVKGLTPQAANNLTLVSKIFSGVTDPAIVKSVDAEGKFQAAYYYDPIGKFLVPLPTITAANFPKLKSLPDSLADTELPKHVHDAISEALQPYSILQSDDHSANLYRDAEGSVVLEGEFANPICRKLKPSGFDFYSVKIPGRIRTKYVLDPKQGFKLVNVEFSDPFMRRWFLGELTQKDWQELATRAQEEARISATQSTSIPVVSLITTPIPLPSSVVTSSSSSATTQPTGGTAGFSFSALSVPVASAAVTSKTASSSTTPPASGVKLKTRVRSSRPQIYQKPQVIVLPPERILNKEQLLQWAVTPSGLQKKGKNMFVASAEKGVLSGALWRDFINGVVDIPFSKLNPKGIPYTVSDPVPKEFVDVIEEEFGKGSYEFLSKHYQQTIASSMKGILQEMVGPGLAPDLFVGTFDRCVFTPKKEGKTIVLEAIFDGVSVNSVSDPSKSYILKFPGTAKFVLDTKQGFRLEEFNYPQFSPAIFEVVRAQTIMSSTTTSSSAPPAPASTSKPVTMVGGVTSSAPSSTASSSSTGNILVRLQQAKAATALHPELSSLVREAAQEIQKASELHITQRQQQPPPEKGKTEKEALPAESTGISVSKAVK